MYQALLRKILFQLATKLLTTDAVGQFMVQMMAWGSLQTDNTVDDNMTAITARSWGVPVPSGLKLDKAE